MRNHYQHKAMATGAFDPPATASGRRDRLIIALSRHGRATGEDTLLRFMERYGLMNLAQASEEQLTEFYQMCITVEPGARA